jgi:hypothetical protein
MRGEQPPPIQAPPYGNCRTERDCACSSQALSGGVVRVFTSKRQETPARRRENVMRPLQSFLMSLGLLGLLGCFAEMGGAGRPIDRLPNRVDAVEASATDGGAARSERQAELGLSAESYSALQAAVEHTRYELTLPPSLSATAEGDPISFHGPNPRQGLDAAFAAEEIQVSPTGHEGSGWSWGMRLARYGRGDEWQDGATRFGGVTQRSNEVQE